MEATEREPSGVENEQPEPQTSTSETVLNLSIAAQQLLQFKLRVPLTEAELQKAEALIKLCTDEEILSIGLGPPEKKSVPKNMERLPMRDRLRAIQAYICSFEYNHTHQYHFNISKQRPLNRIMDTARCVMRDSLPIKCIEAVFLAIYLTTGWEDLDRLPVGFKTRAAGNVYRHIVLVVYHQKSRKYGAMGLSRRRELMDKDLMYDSLAAVISDYKQAYERWGHQLLKLRVGLPVEHSLFFNGPVCWRYLNVSVPRRTWTMIAALLDEHAAAARKLYDKYKSLGCNPEPPKLHAAMLGNHHRGHPGHGRTSQPSPAPVHSQPAGDSEEARRTPEAESGHSSGSGSSDFSDSDSELHD